MKTFTTTSGDTYEVRGGAWLDIMNTCFYDILGKLESGYVLCRERGTDKLFVMYLPYYEKN